MNGYPAISENKKWKAVADCDKSFDGLFFYGVKTTGIFCRPSCKAKTPARGNVVFFDTVEAATAAGFRPCKKCRPDKEVFEPDFELVEKAKSIFEADYAGSIEVIQTAKQLGVSPNHLARLFKKQFGRTPAKYIAALRVGKAAELLAHTDEGILNIAYAAGFRSLSNFYKCFKEQTGQTPKEYREYGGKCNADDIL